MGAKEWGDAQVETEELEAASRRISVRARYLDEAEEAEHRAKDSLSRDCEKAHGGKGKGKEKASKKRSKGSGLDDSSKEPNENCDEEVKPKSHNRSLGERGEEAAARFLVKRGYDIIERNWTCPAGEVDIVAEDGESIVFIEVKTRSNLEKGMPSEAVNEAKRNRYERIAAHFLAQWDKCDVPVRFDVIAILVIGSDRALIRHHINAFGASR